MKDNQKLSSLIKSIIKEMDNQHQNSKSQETGIVKTRFRKIISERILEMMRMP